MKQATDLGRMVKIYPHEKPSDKISRLRELLSEANAFFGMKQFDKGELACAEILTLDPGNCHAFHMLGLHAQQQGNLDLAIDRLRRACDASDASASYHSNLAEMLRMRGLLDEGERCARKAIEIDKFAVSAWNNLGIILQEQGKLEESKSWLEKVIRKSPNDYKAHNNIGTTYRRLGDMKKSEFHWRKALEIAPAFGVPASNLSNLYIELGRYQDAVKFGQIAITRRPFLADAFLNLAAAEKARSNDVQAIKILDRLLGVMPDHPKAIAMRASALQSLDRLEEALSFLDESLVRNPNFLELNYTRALVLRDLGRYDEAKIELEKVMAVPGPIQHTACANYGVMLGELGKSEEAQSVFEDALNTFPNLTIAYLHRGDFIKYKENDPSIVEMQKILEEKTDLSSTEGMALKFALGKAFLDLGKDELAFEYFAAANREKRQTYQYDSSLTSRWMESIAAASTRDAISTRPEVGFQSDVPVFIVGMPRSGTTLVEQILSAHADVFGAGELKIISTMVERMGGVPNLMNNLNSYARAQLGEEYVAKLNRRYGMHKRIVDKMPANFLHVGFIHMIMSKAKIIHVKRNALDTCLSCYTRVFVGEQKFAYDQSELGRFYRDYEKLTQHWKITMPEAAFLEVQYEDIVSDVEAEARRMVSFIGLPWDENCLRFHDTGRPVRTASLNQVRQKIYSSSVGKANRYLPFLQGLSTELQRL